MLALQDEGLFRQIAKHRERTSLPQPPKGLVPLSVLDSAQGIVLDSAPARLTPDIASRFCSTMQSHVAMFCIFLLPPQLQTLSLQFPLHACPIMMHCLLSPPTHQHVRTFVSCMSSDAVQRPHSSSARPTCSWHRSAPPTPEKDSGGRAAAPAWLPAHLYKAARGD